MAHGQEIELAHIEQAGKSLDAFATEVAGRLTDVKSNVERLSRTYRGLGANAFQQSMVNWDATASKIVHTVRELAEHVRQAGGVHAQGDSDAADQFRSTSTSYSGRL